MTDRFSFGSVNPYRDKNYKQYKIKERKREQEFNNAELIKNTFEAASLLDLERLHHCIKRGVDIKIKSPCIRETLLHVALNTMQKRRKQKQYAKKHLKQQEQEQEEKLSAKDGVREEDQEQQENGDEKEKEDELAEKRYEQEFVEYLIKAEIDINAQDCYGNTCVHLASNPYLLHILELMYNIAKPNIKIRNIANRRPLDDAAAMGYLETVQLHLSQLTGKSYRRTAPSTLPRRLSQRTSFLNMNTSLNIGRLRRLSSVDVQEVSDYDLKTILTNADEDGFSILHHAINGGNPEIVSLLLSKGADPFIVGTGQKKTVLQLAVARGNIEIIKMLLYLSPDKLILHMQDSQGNTALHTAVFKDKTDILQILVSEGANVKTKNADKRTPLDEALLKDPVNQHIVDILRGDKKNIKRHKKDMAKKEQSGNIFSKLTEIKDIGGKFRKIMDREKNKEDEHLVEDVEELDAQSQQFLEAASAGNCGVISMCLKQGVNPDVQNSAGETALHIVVEQCHPDLNLILSIIFDAGASPNMTNNRSETALHYAAFRGKSPAMKVLLDHSADPDIQEINGETALFRVIAEKLPIEDSVACTKLLIESGANLNIADDNGLTPLHVATKYGKEDLMQLLVDNGADASLVDLHGRTPLHYIFKLPQDSDTDEIRILVGSPGNPTVNVKEKTGDTALHMAARSQRQSTLITLLEMGADPNLVSGKVPRQLALEILYQDFLVNKNEDHEITNDFSIAESIAEPELILKSPLPLLTALNYSKIFRHIAKSKDDNATYASLSSSCEELAVDLLQTSHTMDDARTLLQHKDYLVFKTGCQDEHKKFMYANYTQRFLQELWYGKIFESYKTWRLVLLPTLYILSPIIYPIMLLVYLFLCLLLGVWVPRNHNKYDGCYAWRKSFKRYFDFLPSATKHSPYIKFVGHLVSFLCFIAVLAIKCLLPFDYENPMPIPAVDAIILLWLAGMITTESKQYRLSNSFASYVQANYLDFIFITALITSYIFQFVALFYTIARNYNISHEEYNTSAQWVIIILMTADIIYALNTLIIFGRLLTYFQVSPFLGPLQLSLFRMAWDVIFVLVILGIVMFAFAASMTKVYLVGLYTVPPGANATELEDLLQPENGSPLIPETVSSMGATLVSLYWSLYGLLDIEDFESSYEVSNTVGKALLGLYLVLAVIVLLNMLIAKISNTYANIQENSRVEWNYARANLIIEYQESQDLPIPFNFIQTIARAIISLFSKCRRCCKKSEVVEVSTENEVKTNAETGGNINYAVKEDMDYIDGKATDINSGDEVSTSNGKVRVHSDVAKTTGNGSTKMKEKERELQEELKEVTRILGYITAEYLKKQEEATRYSLKELHHKMSCKIKTLEDEMRILWDEMILWKKNNNSKLQTMHNNFTNVQEVMRKHMKKKFAARS